VRKVIGHFVWLAEEEVPPALLGLLRHDSQTVRLDVQMLDSLQDTLGEYMELVVVAADNQEDSAVIRVYRVVQTSKLRLVRIFGEGVRDEVGPQPENGVRLLSRQEGRQRTWSAQLHEECCLREGCQVI
jgi:hypothetical protein